LKNHHHRKKPLHLLNETHKENLWSENIHRQPSCRKSSPPHRKIWCYGFLSFTNCFYVIFISFAALMRDTMFIFLFVLFFYENSIYLFFWISFLHDSFTSFFFIYLL
jgi:hypothetical protein